jgi:hypothetical protein
VELRGAGGVKKWDQGEEKECARAADHQGRVYREEEGGGCAGIF